ncbi:caspase family protein [Archangium violaceum]|uniref:caspase family protein n=1 Tax=Archangium violaceum TaxID=83451 RepID=UPI002B2B8BED|nr:caspase family protein [Archangium violaceum]
MKIAVLIGVSNYSIGNLPACRRDVEILAQLLSATGAYQEILTLADDTSSKSIKEKLTSFIRTHSASKPQQVLFYFSGHGEFADGELHMLCSDYEATKRKQTSLENSEVDNLLRQLGAELTVKIIDACHSGVTYIKDKSALETHVQKSAYSFSKCYFLFSSHADQFSFQDNRLSFFTNAIIESAVQFSGREMRFKDIIDYVSDYFSVNPSQRPFFVTQADFTEIFANIPADATTLLGAPTATLPLAENKAEGQPPPAPAPSLLDLIKADAARYCSYEEALEIINTAIPEAVAEHRFSENLTHLYSFQSEQLSNLDDVPKLNDVAKWLDENTREYFVEIDYRTERIEEELSEVERILTQKKTKTRTIRIPASFHPTVAEAIQGVCVVAESKYQNIDSHRCFVVFMVSKTAIRFFYLLHRFQEINWQNNRPVYASGWKTIDAPLKFREQVKDAVHKILNDFDAHIMKPIVDRFAPVPQSTIKTT